MMRKEGPTVPRLTPRQSPLDHAGVDLADLDITPAPLDGLLFDGADPGAAHRAVVRAANDARQSADARHEAAKAQRWAARSSGKRTAAQQA